jgi:predicted nucleic acid-binding protein
LLTCEAVLSESCFLLADLPPARLQLRLWIQSGFLIHRPLDAATVARALALMERYKNVPMAFADACLVAMAESQPLAQIFTIAPDFLIYRGVRDQPLALIAPFAG